MYARRIQAASQAKRRATRPAETRADNTSSASLAGAEEAARLAGEATAFWADREASISVSLSGQRQVEKWLQAQLSQSSIGAVASDNLLVNLDVTRRTLWEAKRDNRYEAIV